MADPGHIPGQVFIPNCLQVRLFWSLGNSKTAFNVLHASYDGVPALSQAVLDTLMDNLITGYADSGLRALQPDDVTFSKVGIRDMRNISDAGEPPVGLGEWTSSVGGSSGSITTVGPLPYATAFVVSLKTGFAGPANRGRVYIPGWHRDADDGGGHASLAAAAAAVSFVNEVKGALDDNSWTLCIGHPARAAYHSDRTGVDHPARSAGTVDVTGVTFLDRQWDTQRLRGKI